MSCRLLFCLTAILGLAAAGCGRKAEAPRERIAILRFENAGGNPAEDWMGRVLSEAARVVRAGGRLLVADMLPHDHEEYRRTMGHVWLGFSERQVERWCAAAGFGSLRWHALPIEPGVKGPGLFVATAAKSR